MRYFSNKGTILASPEHPNFTGARFRITHAFVELLQKNSESYKKGKYKNIAWSIYPVKYKIDRSVLKLQRGIDFSGPLVQGINYLDFNAMNDISIQGIPAHI